MVKAYLRYEHDGSFGVITSGANPCYDASGKLLITSALENVAVWNLKQGSLANTLSPVISGDDASASASTTAAAEVTCMTRAPGGSNQLAVGYSDGTVRMWDVETGACTVSLRGHRSAVSALHFSQSGSLLASGGKDTDIIVWDVGGEVGLYRLKGHKDQVTDLAFVTRGSGSGFLVSSGKDGVVKAWDLDTQHCCQTLAGAKAEVWALAVDPAQTRLVTGSTDHELRVYAVVLPGDTLGEGVPDAGAAGTATGRAPLLRPMGSVKRKAAGNDRVAGLAYDTSGLLLACQGAGKTVEVFRVRGEEEARRKLKRRKKRRREKQARKAQKPSAGAKPKGDDHEGGSSDEDEAGGQEGEEGEDVIKASDELEPLMVVVCKSKVRGCSFAPSSTVAARRKAAASSGDSDSEKGPVVAQLALSLSNNSVEVVDLRVVGGLSDAAAPSGAGATEVVQRLELGGHRSDVRCCALSADDQLLATASNSAVKVWNPSTGACLTTMDSGYGLSLLFAPGGRHVVLGTKEGNLEVFALGAAERVHLEEGAHEGAVWSLAALPDGSGFVSGSADKTVKFWQWSVTVGRSGGQALHLVHARTLRMAEDVLCVRVSPDGKLLAVSLLDSTIKVFFADSLKFFLSLYGHKLPALCLDISSDSTLLVSGSADKNIKVWGLDFGDCHKSLFAHDDAVMSVCWVPNTHYAFTAGKDKKVKYWDLDRMEQLLELGAHHGEVWCLALSGAGDMVVSGGHDRSIRRWVRTREPFFVEEEREKRLESMFEADLEHGQQAQDAPGLGAKEGEEGAAVSAGRRTLEAASAADALGDALEMAAHEMGRLEEQRQLVATAQASGGAVRAPPPLVPNPLLLGMTPGAYVLRTLSKVRAGELEGALIMLPFTDALRLLSHLPAWLSEGAAVTQHVELVARVAVLLLRLHHSQLVSTPSARPALLALRDKLGPSVRGVKDNLGFNLAALGHVLRAAKERAGVMDEEGAMPAAVRALKGGQ